MNKFIPVFCLLFSSLSAYPQQTEEFLGLTEDVRAIVLNLPETQSLSELKFELSPEEADQIKALAELDQAFLDHLKQTGEQCLKEAEISKKVSERTLKIEALIVSSDKKFEQEALGRLGDDYYDVSSLIRQYKEKNPGTDFDTLGLKRREELLSEFSKKELGASIPPGVVMKELAVGEMIQRSGEWKAILQEAKSKLTSDQKIALVSRMGGLFSDRYDYSRSTGKSDGSFVTSSALLDSVKTGAPGGVCRDIALAQVQYLEELGFKQNYVVAYMDNGVPHATVISMDPETKKIVKFNYSDTTTMKGNSGTEALNQDHNLPDRGLSFKLYDTSGKPVTKVSSDLSQVLKDATGGPSDRVFNQKNYSIAKVGFNKDGISGNLFTGRTSAGEEIYGAAVYKKAETENVKLTSGVSVSKLKGERSKVTVDQTNLYLLARAELSTQALKAGPTETKLFGEIESETLITNIKEERKDTGAVKENKKQLDASVDLTLGVKNKYTSPSGKTTVNSEVSATMYPDYAHVASAEKLGPALNQILVRSEVTSAITDDKKALLSAAVIIKKYGKFADVKAVLQDEKRRMTYKAGVSAPLSKDTPTFLPGGEKRLSAGVQKNYKNVVFAIEIDKNLTNKSKSISVKGEGTF